MVQATSSHIRRKCAASSRRRRLPNARSRRCAGFGARLRLETSPLSFASSRRSYFASLLRSFARVSAGPRNLFDAGGRPPSPWVGQGLGQLHHCPDNYEYHGPSGSGVHEHQRKLSRCAPRSWSFGRRWMSPRSDPNLLVPTDVLLFAERQPRCSRRPRIIEGAPCPVRTCLAPDHSDLCHSHIRVGECPIPPDTICSLSTWNKAARSVSLGAPLVLLAFR